jgi:hypothetical protein
MTKSVLKGVWLGVVVGALSLVQGFAAQRISKTLRVEHGRPVIVVSQRSVLLLEFVKEPATNAMVPHATQDIRHCRANYRFQVYHGESDSVTHGEGMVEEVYQKIATTAAGANVKDVGSHLTISAGEFNLSWSEATAGARSWLYYRTDSPIRFIQQAQQLAFEGVGPEQFRGYLASRNVQEFVAAGKTVQVIGPAVFFGELPTDRPVSARIESGRVHDGVFELKLSNLATNKNYVIENSYVLGVGGWTAVHSFIAHDSEGEWSDPLAKDVNMVFYRIREAAY